MSKEVEHDYKCDYCNKPAEYQWQSVQVLWRITKGGDFNQADMVPNIDDDSAWLCEEHMKEW
tara:strand:+ start:69 stop:254 length:186 start_codon:yes stop_codon:yes gene_type:complete